MQKMITLEVDERRLEMSYKVCKLCGQPILKKGQVRKNPNEFRHANGCPLDDWKKKKWIVKL